MTRLLSSLSIPLLCALLAPWSPVAAAPLANPDIDLRPSLQPTPVKEVAAGAVTICGTTTSPGSSPVRVRVTTSSGDTFETSAPTLNQTFTCRFPQDFAGAPPLSPTLLYVDATSAADFGGKDLARHQAETLLIVSGGHGAIPDLPLAFTDDLIDASARTDTQSAQWPQMRGLVNLFMRGRAAKLMRIQQPAFDLDRPGDLAWFKQHATLYDFDHRDCDWSQPLNHRVARGFWQAVWNPWFNPSNDHPWDGNPANRDPKNYRPYTFTNDPADILVLYRMRQHLNPSAIDNRHLLADEVLANLLALQHRGPDNFALREPSGKQEHYTAGAFHYGMFETGEWLTEGLGWFSNPKFRDFSRGGVLNGRAVWALGESLKTDPKGPLAGQLADAIALTLRFCLHDGLGHGYTLRSKSGLPLWSPIAGEHAYLLLGMLAACEVRPDLPVRLVDNEAPRPLRLLTIDALNALAESAEADGNWSRYANATAINIAALAEGARSLASEKNAPVWKAAAMKAADAWLALKPVPSERPAPTPMFGHMTKEGGLTFYLGKSEHAHVSLYIGGHWLHALAVLHSATDEPRYAERAQAILGYYCGNNPLHVRLLNELGAVNNRITDSDDDGIEDTLDWNAYPESTAFVQIGLLHLLQN